MKFNIFQELKFSEENHTCHRIKVVDSYVPEVFHDMWPSDPLECCLVSSSSIDKEICALGSGNGFYSKDEDFMHCTYALETLQSDSSSILPKENLDSTIHHHLLRPGSNWNNYRIIFDMLFLVRTIHFQ